MDSDLREPKAELGTQTEENERATHVPLSEGFPPANGAQTQVGLLLWVSADPGSRLPALNI